MLSAAINKRMLQSSYDFTDCEIETIFIEKLTEKYRLTHRELKKAFNILDKDNSGIFDLNAIRLFCRLHMYGFSENQIDNLVCAFNINGNGFITITEFLNLLLRRIRNSFELNSFDAKSIDIQAKDLSSTNKKSTRPPDVNLSEVYKSNNDRQYMTRTTRPRSAPNNGRQFFTEPFRNDIDNLKSNLDSKRSIASELRHEIANSREFEESEKNGLMSMFAKNKATQVDENVYSSEMLELRTSPLTVPIEDPEEVRENNGKKIKIVLPYQEPKNRPTTANSFTSDLSTINGFDKTNRDMIPSTMFRDTAHTTPADFRSTMEGDYSNTSDNRSIANQSVRSDFSSVFDPKNPIDLNARARVFLQNLKIFLTRESIAIRKVDRNAIHLDYRLSNSSELLTQMSRELLTKRLDEESRLIGRSREEGVTVISYDSFLR